MIKKRWSFTLRSVSAWLTRYNSERCSFEYKTGTTGGLSNPWWHRDKRIRIPGQNAQEIFRSFCRLSSAILGALHSINNSPRDTRGKKKFRKLFTDRFHCTSCIKFYSIYIIAEDANGLRTR